MASGIDVSHWQGTIDWKQVAASKKADFAIIKATEGTGFTDQRFHTNRTQARANGIKVGAYHFFRPEYNAEDQANHFFGVVGSLQAGDIIPWIDVEFLNMRTGVGLADATQNLAMMVLHCEQRFGKPIGIYTASWAWNSLPHNDRFAHLPLWVATWNDNPGVIVLPEGWKNYVIHQYTSEGSIPGISGNVDLNFCPNLAAIVREANSDDTDAKIAGLLEGIRHSVDSISTLLKSRGQ